jgi:hypothetical protein
VSFPSQVVLLALVVVLVLVLVLDVDLDLDTPSRTSPCTIGRGGATVRLRAARDWIALALWALLIFVTVPFVRAFQTRVAESYGSAVFGWAVIACVAMAAALLVIGPWRRRVAPSAWPWLAAIALAYVAWTAFLWEDPEETVHFVEYAVLGVLAFRALAHHVRDWSVLLSATLVGSMIGVCDEIVQWLTPGRVADFRDMVINGGAVGLIQVAILKLGAMPRPAVRSLRLVLRLGAALVALVGLCLAATPARVGALIERAPVFAFMTRNPEPMCEYGFAHHDPQIGRFKSRFSLAELARLDALRGAEVAAVIDHFPRGRYGAFLKQVPSWRDPFTHEVRVHIYNRDYHFSLLRTYRDDPTRRHDHATVAWREHQLLMRYYGKTLAHSAKHQFERWRLALMEQYRDPEGEFRSKAGSRIVTVASETTLRLLLVTVLLALLGADLYLGYRSRRCPC